MTGPGSGRGAGAGKGGGGDAALLRLVLNLISAKMEVSVATEAFTDCVKRVQRETGQHGADSAILAMSAACRVMQALGPTTTGDLLHMMADMIAIDASDPEAVAKVMTRAQAYEETVRAWITESQSEMDKARDKGDIPRPKPPRDPKRHPDRGRS